MFIDTILSSVKKIVSSICTSAIAHSVDYCRIAMHRTYENDTSKQDDWYPAFSEACLKLAFTEDGE